jgi:formyltetrahydrofolate deformylase
MELTTTPPTAAESVASGSAGPRVSAVARLLISCPDRPGIVAAVSRFLHESGANIVSSDQHTTDPRGGSFFMRMEFHLPLDGAAHAAFEQRFGNEVGVPFEMGWQMWPAATPKRVAVLVSRYDHCLLDILWRHRREELEADVGLVISNHPDRKADVEAFGLAYEHVPVPKGGKPEAEDRMIELLAGRFDLVILARYMQILSADFLDRLAIPVINIHHSFLPAFAGAGPYQRAREQGVKLVGATAHYVTPELDAGPIIEQDVMRVTHRGDAATLERLGADIERTVFARAVKWHCEDRVLLHGNTTIVF